MHSLNAVPCSSVPDVVDKFIVETLGTNIVRSVCEGGHYRAPVTEKASSFGMTDVGERHRGEPSPPEPQRETCFL